MTSPAPMDAKTASTHSAGPHEPVIPSGQSPAQVSSQTSTRAEAPAAPGRTPLRRQRARLAVTGVLLLLLAAMAVWIAPWHSEPDSPGLWRPAPPRQSAALRVRPTPPIALPVQLPAAADGETTATPARESHGDASRHPVAADSDDDDDAADVDTGTAGRSTGGRSIRPPAPPLNNTHAASEPAESATTAGPPAVQLPPADGDDADSEVVAPAQEGDEPLDEVPPATADAPAVRDAWLQRIHALIDAGDVAGARVSLHAFVQRYPDYALPEDLHALMQ